MTLSKKIFRKRDPPTPQNRIVITTIFLLIIVIVFLVTTIYILINPPAPWGEKAVGFCVNTVIL